MYIVNLLFSECVYLMNKIAAVIGLCVFCTVSSFAQGQILKQVERGVARAGFVQKKSLSAVVNGYLRTPGVTQFTLPSGAAMRAVRFSRNIALTKEQLLVPEGSLAVVNPEGKITLYGPDEVLPAEIQNGLDAAFEREFPGFLEFMEAITPAEETATAAAKPWTGKTSYDAQVDLAKDMDAYYQGNADEVLNARTTGQEVKVYRVPSRDIYYQPVGRAGRYLNPNEDLVVFYPSQNDGQIIFGGVTDATWRMFFEPRP